MRLLGQLLKWMLLLLLVAAGWQQLFNRLLSGDEGGEIFGGDYETSLVYQLERERWTRFRLQPADTRLRLVTNAGADLALLDAESVDESGLGYAVEWRLTTDDGEVIEQAVHHYRSRRSLYPDPAGGEPRAANFILSSRWQPLDGRVTLINLAGHQPAAQIELRLASAEPPIEPLVVRLYRRERLPDHQLAYRWQRMGEAQRQRLARASIYPVELLRDSERMALLRHRWLPLGPVGVEGSDYQSRRLYRLIDSEESPIEPAVAPEGRLVAPARRLLFPLPAPPGRYRIRWQRSGTLQPPPAATPLRFHWYGNPATRQREWQQPWSGDEGAYEGELAAGRLVMESDQPLVVRLERWQQGAWVDETPEPLRIRLYGWSGPASAPGTRLRRVGYRLAAVEGAVVRIDLRHQTQGPTGGAATVAYRLLDGDGKPLESGQLALVGEPSALERPADHALDPLTRPARYHLALPAGSDRLEFDLPPGIFVAAYSRLERLERVTTLPAPGMDGFSEASNDSNGAPPDGEVPAWFAMRPHEHQTLHDQGATLLLEIQGEEPEIDPELLAGRYQWESYQPAGEWRGRRLVLPQGEGLPQRDGGSADRLFELVAEPSVGGTLRAGGEFRFVGTAAAPSRPQLFYQRRQGDRLQLALELDGAAPQSLALGAISGLIPLPPVATGKRRLTLLGGEGSGWGRFMISGVEGDGGWLNLMSPRLGPRQGGCPLSGGQVGGDCTLRFDYRKQSGGEELLSIRYFALSGDQREQRLRIEIGREGERWLRQRPPGPHRQWSIVRRLYRLPPLPPGDGVVVGSEERIDQGRRIYLPLGEDLPAGDYRLTITLEQGRGGYMILARTRPGRVAHWELIHE